MSSSSKSSSVENEQGPLLGSAATSGSDVDAVYKDPIPLGNKHKVQVCCFPAPCLEEVPVVRTIFKKNEEKGTFSSSIAVLLSMLGSVVGTGNIWRFPRIVANHSTGGGGLVFLIVWFSFLWFWSMPIILIEYGIGRFTKKSTVESFNKLLGPSYRFLGGFQGCVGFCLGSYYSVLVGWCFYYLVTSVVNELPPTKAAADGEWAYLQSTNWPVLCHGLAIIASGLSVSRGVSTIEPVNKVLVPVLLTIVVFCFYWAIFLDNADSGIVHMFSPDWESFGSSSLWLDAISQNAWDTGAGLGTFLTYATFMRRTQGAVKLGSMTPILNNLVSLMCGILIFSTVFSVQIRDGVPHDDIVNTLQDSGGDANTGLTFIWMPLLFQGIPGGRFFAICFFLCLSFAGLSSLISLMEMPIHILTDFGIKRIPATFMVALAMFFLGLGSAIDTQVLVNQDSVWAYAMILSGCFLLYLVFRYGPLRFRKNLYNGFGIGDWPLPIVWVFIVVVIAPIEGVGLIIWWIVEQIVENGDTWWQITTDSLAVTLAEWAFVLLVMIGLNWWMEPLVIHPPYNPTTRKILGFFVKYTPRPKKDPPPSDIITPPRSPLPKYGSLTFSDSGAKNYEQNSAFKLYSDSEYENDSQTSTHIVVKDAGL